MEVTLILSDVEHAIDHDYPHFGVMALSASLKRAGHSVDFHNYRFMPEKAEFQSRIRERGNALIAFSSVTNQWDYITILAEWAKEVSTARTVVGGYHPTLCPEDCIRVEAFDMICVGEGDLVLPEIADAIDSEGDLSKIANVWIRTEAGVIRNPLRRLIDNLDELPSLDYDIYDMADYLPTNGGMLPYMTGRGCPYKCTYCSNPAINDVYRGNGRIVRRRSPERVVADIRDAIDKYGSRMTSVTMADETFTINKPFLKALYPLWQRELNSFPFEFMTSARDVSFDLLKMGFDAGNFLIRYGVESGNDWLRNSVLMRDMTDDEIVQAFGWCDEIGIRTATFAMIGLPYETPEMARQTIDFHRKIKPDEYWLTIFYPFKGTGLYDLCAKEGWIARAPVGNYFQESILDMPGFPMEKIAEYKDELVRVCTETAAMKRPRGYFDFIERKNDAKYDGDWMNRIFCHTLFASYRGRYWLILPPDSSLTYDVEVNEGSVLVTAFGVDQREFDDDFHGATFEILIDGEVVATKFLDPGINENDRVFTDVEVDLSEYIDKAIGTARLAITLRVTGVRKEKRVRLCGFGRPHIRVKKGSKRDTNQNVRRAIVRGKE
ncbi:MAG: B12-binding domain-containing radical SAM protein [Planctomycetes bacterium]|nr:B12-binding domain-containing radical SAM protein [Planctomycetota bacterium]